MPTPEVRPSAKAFDFVKIALSKIRGWGVFARQDIPNGTLLEEYKGELIPPGEPQGGSFAWSLGNGWEVDAVDPTISNWTRYVNGSKREPNVEARIDGIYETNPHI